MAHRSRGLELRDPIAGPVPLLHDADPGTRSGPFAASASSPRGRHGLIMAGAALLILSAAAAWLGAPWGNKAGSTAPPSPALRSVRVSAGTATRQLVAMGTVAPARSVAVTAPYDGSIAEKKVALGDTVAERDVLIVMNAEDIQSRGREARSATLKAAIALDALTHWEAGPEVTRARRGVEAARTVLARLERKVNDTRQLYDRGIVSRVEFEAAEQERDNQAFTVATAEQDLTATLARGGADSRRLAELELENAKARLADVQRQADGTIVRAPVAGVIVKPPTVNASGAVPQTVETGARVQRGQTLFSVADLSSLIVDGKVDEIDVNQIRIGQSVAISSDAFPGLPLRGHVVGVSSEATQDSANQTAMFNVRVLIDDTKKDDIRIGMSARMTIELDARPGALFVPIGAVRRGPSGATTVKLIDSTSGQAQERSVRLGVTTPTSVQILSGLEDGDVVAVE